MSLGHSYTLHLDDRDKLAVQAVDHGSFTEVTITSGGADVTFLAAGTSAHIIDRLATLLVTARGEYWTDVERRQASVSEAPQATVSE